MIFSSRHRVYNVYVKPTLAKPYEQPVFVEEGFNFKAFLFTAVWTLYHRLWWASIAIGACNALFLLLVQNGTVSETGQVILQFGLALLVGYQANDWHAARLERRGYVLADIVTGDSLLRAEQRFFDRYFAANASVVAV